MKKSRKVLSLSLALFLSINTIPIPTFAAQIEKQIVQDNIVQNQEIYNQYIQIAKEVSELTNQQINVLPIDELKKEDWVSTDKFRERALCFATLASNANTNFNSENLDLNSQNDYSKNYLSSTYAFPVSCTGYYKFSASNITSEVAISADFTTIYNGIRQMIGGVNSISSKISSGSVGKWTQISDNVQILDGGRTAKITVSGTFEYLGLLTNLYAYSYFRCSANGGITATEY